MEAVSLQEDGTAPSTASPGWDVGAAGSGAVSPEPPSAVASLTVHMQCSQLIDWPQKAGDDQGDGTTAREIIPWTQPRWEHSTSHHSQCEWTWMT